MKNFATIKNNFPIFRHHPDLVYLDSAATTLKPQSVIDAMTGYSERYSANVGRGLYPLAEKTTEKFEEARGKVASFIGASPDEIVFTHGATEGFNLLAASLGAFLEPGDNIVVTEMEHHSNFLPWKRLAKENGIDFRILPIDPDGKINEETLGSVIDKDTAIVTFPAISNVLGTKIPVADIVRKIKEINPDTKVIVDAAQAVGHAKIDVSAWGADFIVFSGHKMLGPTGVGVLWGRHELLEKLPPYQLGGGMVSDSCAKEPTWKEAPYRFEAGTPDIAAAIGLGAAVDFLSEVGMDAIEVHETGLTRYAMTRLVETFGDEITMFGATNPENHAGLISFTLSGIHPHDLAQILGEKSICIRAGEHCASPIHRKLGLSATARISFSIYNDKSDIDTLIKDMKDARERFTI